MIEIGKEATPNDVRLMKSLLLDYLHGPYVSRPTLCELSGYNVSQVVEIGKDVIDFRYLRGTSEAGVRYAREELFTLLVMKAFEPVVPRTKQGPALKGSIDYGRAMIERPDLLAHDVTIAAYGTARHLPFHFVAFTNGKPPHRERKRKLEEAAIAVSMTSTFLSFLTALAQHGDQVAADLLRMLVIPDAPPVEPVKTAPGVVKADLGPALPRLEPRRPHQPKVGADLHVFRLAQLTALAPRNE